MNGRLDAVLGRLISVKLWMALIGVASVWLFGDELGAEQQAQISGAISALFIFVQGFVDALTGPRPTGGPGGS